MRFAFYKRLNATRQATYRRSDAISSVPLPTPEALRPLIPEIVSALADEEQTAVQVACQSLADGLTHQLASPPVHIVVLAVRPSNTLGELHGLYEPSEPPYRSRITLWMRTAQRERVVAFRTFFRTLLHEVLHHLDYEVYDLPETFHTAGFYKRESSLFHQLVPDPGRLEADLCTREDPATENGSGAEKLDP